MRLLIMLKLPAKVVREMDVYREKYNPEGLAHLSSHITLVPPFTLRGRFIDLMRDLKRLLSLYKPFSMKIDGIGSFGNKVLFFKPNCPPKELMLLQSALKNFIGKNYRRGQPDDYWMFERYNPHITIAHRDTPENIREYKNKLKGLKYARTLWIRGVVIYARRKNKRWILKKEIDFGSKFIEGRQTK